MPQRGAVDRPIAANSGPTRSDFAPCFRLTSTQFLDGSAVGFTVQTQLLLLLLV